MSSVLYIQASHLGSRRGPYSLLNFRCSALQHIDTDFRPLRQPVPGGMTDDQYLAWLYEQAEEAKQELDALMTRVLSLLNDATGTADVTKRLEEEEGNIPKVLVEFVRKFDTSVHRSATSRRPYWKMGPVKKRDRVLAKSAADFSKLEKPHTSHITDFIRCTAYFDDPLTLALCFVLLQSLSDVPRVKNRFTSPGWFGYRDMNLNVRLSNGHLAEVQLGFDSLMILKDWMHPNYEIARTANTRELSEVCRDRNRARTSQVPRASLVRMPDDDDSKPFAAQGQDSPRDDDQEKSITVLAAVASDKTSNVDLEEGVLHIWPELGIAEDAKVVAIEDEEIHIVSV